MAKNKGGRPKIPIVTPDLETVDKNGKLPPLPIILSQVYHWMDLQATAEEISGAFRVSVGTLDRKLKEATDMGFSELRSKISGPLKLKLRQNQLDLSKNNPTMAIYLGKLWLGQQDVEKMKDVINDFTHLLKLASSGRLDEFLSQKNKK